MSPFFSWLIVMGLLALIGVCVSFFSAVLHLKQFEDRPKSAISLALGLIFLLMWATEILVDGGRNWRILTGVWSVNLIFISAFCSLWPVWKEQLQKTWPFHWLS